MGSDVVLVLIVAADAGIGELLTAIFEQLGAMEVIPCRRGREAFHLAQLLRPALTVIDLPVKPVEELELMQLLKARPRTQGMPIFALVSHKSMGEKAMLAGATACFEKPFDVDDLLGMAERYLPSADGAAPTAGSTLGGRAHEV